MPIQPAEMQFRRAGASGLGGAKSATAVDPAALFPLVSNAEHASGITRYRCFYVNNGNASLTLDSALAWLKANTPYSATVMSLGLGTSGVGGVEQTIATETTAPVGVAFVAAATAGAGIALGNLAPGQHRALWARLVVSPGPAPSNQIADSAIVQVDGGYSE